MTATDPVYSAARDLIRRSKDADAVATVGYRQALAPYIASLEGALAKAKPVSSARLIAELGNPRIAAAVNERGGGRGS